MSRTIEELIDSLNNLQNEFLSTWSELLSSMLHAITPSDHVPYQFLLDKRKLATAYCQLHEAYSKEHDNCNALECMSRAYYLSQITKDDAEVFVALIKKVFNGSKNYTSHYKQALLTRGENLHQQPTPIRAWAESYNSGLAKYQRNGHSHINLDNATDTEQKLWEAMTRQYNQCAIVFYHTLFVVIHNTYARKTEQILLQNTVWRYLSSNADNFCSQQLKYHAEISNRLRLSVINRLALQGHSRSLMAIAENTDISSVANRYLIRAIALGEKIAEQKLSLRLKVPIELLKVTFTRELTCNQIHIIYQHLRHDTATELDARYWHLKLGEDYTLNMIDILISVLHNKGVTKAQKLTVFPVRRKDFRIVMVRLLQHIESLNTHTTGAEEKVSAEAASDNEEIDSRSLVENIYNLVSKKNRELVIATVPTGIFSNMFPQPDPIDIPLALYHRARGHIEEPTNNFIPPFYQVRNNLWRANYVATPAGHRALTHLDNPVDDMPDRLPLSSRNNRL